jgi:hypothetical protein
MGGTLPIRLRLEFSNHRALEIAVTGRFQVGACATCAPSQFDATVLFQHIEEVSGVCQWFVEFRGFDRSMTERLRAFMGFERLEEINLVIQKNHLIQENQKNSPSDISLCEVTLTSDTLAEASTPWYEHILLGRACKERGW